jgi:hypothetical protein
MSRHPRWDPTCEGAWKKGTDFMSEKGAHRLATRIVMAWAAAGHEIRVQVVPIAGRLDGIWTVRLPDIVNGLPVKQVPL